jgi:type I restriction enzyme M protein
MRRRLRKWFVDHDLVDGVIYLPDNLFYNTSAPGIIIFLNKHKPVEHENKLFLLNASREFEKGDPKNYIPNEAIVRIADTFRAWREVDKYSRIVTRDEILTNDYSISPSRYVQAGEAEAFRPILEILDELRMVEDEGAEIDGALKDILSKLLV